MHFKPGSIRPCFNEMTPHESCNGAWHQIVDKCRECGREANGSRVIQCSIPCRTSVRENDLGEMMILVDESIPVTEIRPVFVGPC
jgi:hypothetical protein